MRVLITERVLFDKNHNPIMLGKSLLATFRQVGTVVLVCSDEERMQQDIILHALDPENQVSVREMNPLLSVTDNLERLGGHFDLLIDSDPAVVTWAYGRGIKCLLAMEPKFMDPRFRPDSGGVVAWSHLVDEMESQTRLLADKRRTWETSGFNTWE